MKDLNHTKYEDAFFRLTEKEIFTSAIIEYPDQWYEDLKENMRLVKIILPECQKDFEREIIEQISRPIDVRFYLLRIKERIENLVSELSIENMKEIKHTYGQEGLTYVNSAYLFLAKVKSELLNFINDKLKILGFDMPKNHHIDNIKTYGIPTFNPDQIDIILNKFKNYFDQTQLKELTLLLTTGEKQTKDFLLFNSEGKQLADAFRQLFEAKFITNCQKKDLWPWIMNHFKFIDKSKSKPFTESYIKKLIERKSEPSKNPIFTIKDGKIQ